MKKVVFVSHPLKEDVNGNSERVKQICRQLISENIIPLATHLLFPPFLDDDVQEEREIGMVGSLELLKRADEIWVYGDRITEGMEKEIELAESLKIPIVYKSDELSELNEK